MEKITNILAYEILKLGKYEISIYTIIIILAIFVGTKLLLFVIRKSLFRRTSHHRDVGNTYALFQIIKYVIWIIAFGSMLETVGIQLTLLIAGSAALLVGIGLGLQQTFNDIVSGIILLTERSIKVDDVLEIDGDIVRIESIGLRASKGTNRDEISIIIPNSLITTNKVINWSYQTRKARFRISVNVAYESDIDLVIKALTESVDGNPEVNHDQKIDVRLLEFGSSGIAFQVLFYSESIFRIEKVKSDIRMNINQKFKEYNITIPFPQMDLNLKSIKGKLDGNNETEPAD
ncbi:MAG: mechanosensitive ion channel domain-containing protein [Saprospiraceae bacterium]